MGADIKIKCQGCGAVVMFPRHEFERKLKKVIEKAQCLTVLNEGRFQS